MKNYTEQELIEYAREELRKATLLRDDLPFGLDAEDEKEVVLIEIALAALTDKTTEQLKAERDALAHECGMMSGLLNDICRYHEECTYNDQAHAVIPLEYVSAINSFVERDVDGENPCPLTDAYLNSVRAEGVEMFGAWQKDLAYQSQGDLRHAYVGSVKDATVFAAQLRAGKASNEVNNAKAE